MSELAKLFVNYLFSLAFEAVIVGPILLFSWLAVRAIAQGKGGKRYAIPLDDGKHLDWASIYFPKLGRKNAPSEAPGPNDLESRVRGGTRTAKDAGECATSYPAEHRNSRIMGLRALAWMLDSALISLLWFALTSWIPGAVEEAAVQARGSGGVLAGATGKEAILAQALTTLIAMLAFWPAAAIPYYTLQEGLLGRTLGKHLFGIRVIYRGSGGKPGLLRAFVRTLLRFVDGIFCYAVGWFFAMLSEERRRAGDVLAGTAVVGVDSVRKAERVPSGEEARVAQARSRAGAAAERRVAEELLPLAKYGFYVFADLLTERRGNIDHLAVGPVGLFIIETKSHRGSLTVGPGSFLLRDGSPFEKDFVEQMRAQAEGVRRNLSYGHGSREPFRGYLCFTRARLSPPPGERFVGICALEDLKSEILAGPSVLSPREVEALARKVELAYGKVPEVCPLKEER